MMTNDRTWWHDRRTLARFVGDLLQGELARLRPGQTIASVAWPPDARLGDCGIDSLERLHLATALAEVLHFERSGIGDTLLTRDTVEAWVESAAASLDRYADELTFRTSGSTGQAKWFTHRLADLAAEVDVLAALLGTTRRILGAVPSHHIYGFLFTILLARRLEVAFVDVRSLTPSRLGELAAPGDLVVAHPAYWRAFVRVAREMRPAVAGVTSTAPCPPELAQAVRAAGIERLVEVYGSSETAGVGWRDDPAAPFSVFPYWRRGANAGELVRRGADGADRRVELPDEVAWSAGDRSIRPIGRREGVVQVGGVNVSPDHVAARLATRPGVAAAAVRLMRPAEGERLKAFIVPSDLNRDRASLQAELQAWIDTHLSVAERPKSIVVGPALPVGALGKNADWSIEPAPDERISY